MCVCVCENQVYIRYVCVKLITYNMYKYKYINMNVSYQKPIKNLYSLNWIDMLGQIKSCLNNYPLMYYVYKRCIYKNKNKIKLIDTFIRTS